MSELEIGNFTLADELDFRITHYKNTQYPERVLVHPWHRDYRDHPIHPGIDSSVAITLGYLDESGEFDDAAENWHIMIVDRAQFVEGLLAVFPELQRASN